MKGMLKEGLPGFVRNQLNCLIQGGGGQLSRWQSLMTSLPLLVGTREVGTSQGSDRRAYLILGFAAPRPSPRRPYLAPPWPPRPYLFGPSSIRPYLSAVPTPMAAPSLPLRSIIYTSQPLRRKGTEDFRVNPPPFSARASILELRPAQRRGGRDGT